VRLLALALLALVLAAPAAASEQHPTLGELEGQLMCPICEGETLAQSDSPAAQRIKAYVQQRIDQGATRSEIKRELVQQWGTRILAAPPRHGFDLLAWLLPIVGVLGGAAVIGALAWRWSRQREPAAKWTLTARPLGPEDERRVDEELRRFDG
jgi:cytochrome c-type biogenesis protein CcmH